MDGGDHDRSLNFLHNPLPMWVHGQDTLRFLAVNEAMVLDLGHTQEALLEMRLPDLVPPEDVPRLLEHLRERRSPHRHDGVWRLRTAAGGWRDMAVASQETFFRGEMATFAVAIDVSGQRRAEEAARSAEALNALILESMAGGLLHLGRDGGVLHANEQALHLLGMARGELMGRRLTELPDAFFLEDGSPCTEERHPASRCLRTGEPQAPLVLGLGQPGAMRLWAVFSVMPLRSADGGLRGAVVTFLDLTDRKLMEVALREEREFFLRTINSLPGVFYAFDEAGRFLRWNRNLELVTGYRGDEIAAMHPLDFIPAGDREQVGRRIVQAFTEGEATADSALLTKDGRSIPYFFTGRRMVHEGRPLLLGTGLDVSGRVQAEAALLRAQKLESLGILAGGVAHDFNNLLTSIMGNLELLARTQSLDAPGRKHLERIDTALSRAADLCRQMLAYSGKGRFVVRAVDLNAAIVETVELLKASISKSVRLELDLSPGLPQVEVDPAQIQQALLNLVVNASEAVGAEEGLIRLRTELREVPAGSLLGAGVGAPVDAGRYVALSVADTGPGMEAGVQERVFDPFFTTKFPGRGLGLSAVLGIMRGNRGAVLLDSRPGEGARFTLLFHPMGEEAAPLPPPPELPSTWRGRGTVLVVDDEEEVRLTITHILERHGFQVVPAGDGRAGVDTWRARRDELRLVLMDLAMPRLGGLEAAREILDEDPGARVILMSGFDPGHPSVGLADLPLRGVLRKPFRMAELMDLVRRTLEDPAPDSRTSA